MTPALTAQLREIVAKHLEIPVERVTDDAEMIGAHGLGGDDLDHVEIIMEIEDLLDCHIPDDAQVLAVTFGDLVRVVDGFLKVAA